ncbi:MAG: hypothetical protein Phog2KO_33570 [Phototrophicaceae bacterium]
MKKWLMSLVAILILIPSIFVFAQNAPPSPTIEITGANASDLPTITITTSVLDSNNLPVAGLTIDDFTLGGDLEGLATIVNVENITLDNLPFATVLLIDTSTSMSGLPLQQAKEAASLFVQSVGDDDPIAIVTFNTRTRLVQDYTTDKDLLLDVINSLQVTGRTALYDAAVLGVEVAASAPVPRRAVILLSDGAEFGGDSLSLRGDGLTNAIQNGVSFYTVGLGFGTDRTFLQELADGTNARNYESPTPAELTAIYGELATLFRTQYVVTLESNIAGDGTVYEFTLQSESSQGATNVDTGTIRAPIPVPIVNLDDNLFSVPFSSPVTISPTILADDDLSEILVTVNGEAIESNVDGSFTLDPIAYPPETYALEVTATDVDGDVGSDAVNFETAALASEIVLDFESGTVISEPTTITISADGQTPAISTIYTITDGDTSEQFDANTDAENGFPLLIEPYQLESGDYDLVIGVENEGGATSNLTVPFTIASLPPSNINLEGLDTAVEISEPTSFAVSADTQAGASLDAVSVTIAGQDAPLEDLMIRPASLQPGTVNLEVTATDSNGASVTETIPVMIASLPPQILFGDLPDPIMTDTVIDITVDSQTDLLSVVYNFGDDVNIALDPLADGTYSGIPLNIQMLGEGETTIVVTATNSGGATASETLMFNIVLPTPMPNLTATAEAGIAQTSVAVTSEFIATTDAQSTLDAQEAEANAQATSDAQSTLDAQEAEATVVVANVEATEIPTEIPTETEVVLPTATITETPQSTAPPVTLTPVEIVEVGAQSSENPPTEGNLTGIAVCGGGILLLLILLGIVFFGRGRNRDETA